MTFQWEFGHVHVAARAVHESSVFRNYYQNLGGKFRLRFRIAAETPWKLTWPKWQWENLYWGSSKATSRTTSRFRSKWVDVRVGFLKDAMYTYNTKLVTYNYMYIYLYNIITFMNYTYSYIYINIYNKHRFYLHMYTHTYTHICTRIYIHIYTHMYIEIDIHTHIYIDTVHMYMSSNKHISNYILPVCIHLHVYTFLGTLAYMYINRYLPLFVFICIICTNVYMQKSVDLLTWIRCSCKNSCLENIRIAFIYDNGAEVRISSFWK